MATDDFEWCDVHWDGPGGAYSMHEGAVVENHVCMQHKPGHTEHVCCCGAVKENEE